MNGEPTEVKVNGQNDRRALGLLLSAATAAGLGYLFKKLGDELTPAPPPPGARMAPGPDGVPLLGILPGRFRDQLAFFTQMRREYGDVMRFRVGPRILHLVSHPDGAKYVFQDNNRNYVKGRGLEKTKDLLGEGLLTSEGSFWRRQRRLIQPIFHHRRLPGYAVTMADATAAMLERWQPKIDTGEPVDIAEEMMRLTLDIVSKTLFSTALTEDEFDTVAAVMRPLLQHTTRAVSRPFDITEDWPTPANRRQGERLQELNAIVYRIIGERRAADTAHEDVLGLLMAAQDEETGDRMTDEQIRDEVMTLFLAGHETTANLLSFTWALLSQHVDVRRQLQAEVDDLLHGRQPAATDVEHLVYTNMVLHEALRLFPPAWIIGREPIADDVIGGYFIPAGSGVLISPYVIHRHPDFWTNPEGFDPGRFEEARTHQRHRYAYIPFGGGPRLCIGNNFALTEAAIVVATISQHLDLDLLPGKPVEPEVAFTLRPRDGVWMTLHQRPDSASGKQPR